MPHAGDMGTKHRRSKYPLRTSIILKSFWGHFDPGGDTRVEPYTRGASEEILHVIEGEFEVAVNGSTNHLGELDSLHYKSDQPHRIAEATGTGIARVVWMMAPPTY